MKAEIYKVLLRVVTGHRMVDLVERGQSIGWSFASISARPVIAGMLCSIIRRGHVSGSTKVVRANEFLAPCNSVAVGHRVGRRRRGFVGFYPDADVTVAVLTNLDGGHLYDGHFARRLARALLKLPESRPSGKSPPQNGLGQFAGTYRIGSDSIAVRADSYGLIVDGATVNQLWERVFVHRDRGVFTSVENPEVGLRFTVSEQGASAEIHSAALRLTPASK
jgi:hypothetical protein